MRIVFVTPQAHTNSLGRTQVLWQLAQTLGWSTRTLAMTGDQIWAPVRDTEFGRSVEIASDPHLLSEAVETCDLVVSVKPVVDSLPAAWRAAQEHNKPLLQDIDDPDLESTLALDSPVRRSAKWLLRRDQMLRARGLWRLAQGTPRMVSNPYLQRYNGGTLVPHARSLAAVPAAHAGSEVVVAFIGSVRLHKGLPLLREAIGRLAPEGYRLLVTSDRPADAAPWETWVGTTTTEQGAALLRDSDIVATPSLNSPWSRGQLPVKIIDAMATGVPVVASRVEPQPWAIGDAGLVVRPGNLNDLVSALRQLGDRELRVALGEAGRRRVARQFSFEAVSEEFRAACEGAVSSHFAVSSD